MCIRDSTGDMCVGGWPCLINIPEAGAAYVFRYDVDHWVFEDVLWAEDHIQESANFGVSTYTDGTKIVVGASYEDPSGAGIDDNSGAIYVFSHDGSGAWPWVLDVRIDAYGLDDGSGGNYDAYRPDGRLGGGRSGIVIDDDILIAGSRGDDVLGTDSVV